MSKPAPNVCENCRHWCIATETHHSTCQKGNKQRYIWPAKLGDAHGYGPVSGRCFEARPEGAPMFVSRKSGRGNRVPGVAVARKLKEAA